MARNVFDGPFIPPSDRPVDVAQEQVDISNAEIGFVPDCSRDGGHALSLKAAAVIVHAIDSTPPVAADITTR